MLPLVNFITSLGFYVYLPINILAKYRFTKSTRNFMHDLEYKIDNIKGYLLTLAII